MKKCSNVFSKEKIEKQLDKILKDENREMIKLNYPTFKKLEGKCFKTKNFFSCPTRPSDYWWLYTKVLSIKPSDIYDTKSTNGITAHFTGYSFQTTKYGNVDIEKNKSGYVHSLDQEITEKEFNTAWNKMMEEIGKLK
jgi:hypothetical protein